MDRAGDGTDVLRRLDEIGARHFWVVYHNYAALAQAKVVPAGRFAEVAAEGVTFAKANWDFTIDDHQIEHPGFGADSGDFRVVPDASTVVPIPYRPGVAQAFGRIVDDLGDPWPGDPRARLGGEVEALAGLGLTARVAFESELILVRPTDDGWVPAERGRMFTIDEVEARWTWCAAVLDSLEAMGVAVHQLASEYGPGQYEISLLPTDPVTAVDRYLLARQVIRALARDAGLVASFMPRPWTDLPSNGVHVHVSMWDADGDDAMADPATEDGLSERGAAAIAGLIEHAPAQAALGAPTPNSYKRLLPGSWAPAHVCWAFGNRSALVRVPGRGAARHVEYRMGDAAANPYLHLTGILAAMRDGILRRTTLPPPAEVDVGHLSDADALARGFRRLPLRLDVALDALEADVVLRAALGPVISEHYLALKRFEMATYLARAGADPATTAVTDWERTTYLEQV